MPQIMQALYRFLGVLSLFLLFHQAVNATHIRAGEITAERVSPQALTFRITVVGYTDTRSQVVFGPGDIDFGDGRVERLNTEADFNVTQPLGNQVAKNTFVITHTFQGPGTYTIRFREFNRNDRTLNMDNSVETPFYIETQIVIDPFIGVNSSPVLTIPPVDNGGVGIRYIHNPGAFDPDGDSLAYELTVPRQAFQRPVNNFRSPASNEFSFAREDGSTPPFLEIDPITGDLIWDAPGLAGQYNVAFKIKEFRRLAGEWVQIGYVVRDMQIIIENTDNQRPELILPPDLCVVAGTRIEEIIQGMDPDGDPIRIELFGDPLEINTSPATFTPRDVFQGSPGVVNFEWQTVCAHVREAPYQVRVRITDQPRSGPALVDIQTINIRVIGPPPVIEDIEQNQNRSVTVNWEPYACVNSAERMQVWRRLNSDPFEPDSCETGIREGFELVGSVAVGQTSFLDDNFGQGLDPGNTYCYRLVSTYPAPRFGNSIVSNEFCITVDVDVPLITNVTVEATDTENGEILVRWTPPYDIDPVEFPGPFTYELIRSNNFTGNTNRTSLITTSDTVFTDTGINTENLVYNYRVLLRQGNTLIDSSSTASSVRLSPIIINEAIELNWNFEVPWNNRISEFTHLVFRNRTDPEQEDVDTFELIAEINPVTGSFTFLDDGSFNGVPLSRETEYCYFVETRGAYDVDLVPRPLVNRSQVVCARPDDDRLPCPPTLTFTGPDCADFLADRPCGFANFEHNLSWEPDFGGVCDDELNAFRLYFSETGAEGTFDVVRDFGAFERNGTIRELMTFKGCYFITAIDRSGNESAPSNTVCVDNCPNYELPNVFTPNGDGTNETFMAFDNPFVRCPRFVESVEIFIVNRWGVEVFRYNSLTAPENDIFIRWDGRDRNGNELPAGTYFYSANVRFDALDPSLQQQQLRGTVQIIR